MGRYDPCLCHVRCEAMVIGVKAGPRERSRRVRTVRNAAREHDGKKSGEERPREPFMSQMRVPATLRAAITFVKEALSSPEIEEPRRTSTSICSATLSRPPLARST